MNSPRLFLSKSGWGKALIGFIVGVVMSGGAAYSLSVNNTPEGGYLLCYSTRTGSVTFPGKLSCPNGTKSLEVSGVNTPRTQIPSSSLPTATPSPAQSNLKCTLGYLLKYGSNIPEGIASCTDGQMSKLMNEIQVAIDEASSNNANDSTESEETKKKLNTILAAIMFNIQKKVKS